MTLWTGKRLLPYLYSVLITLGGIALQHYITYGARIAVPGILYPTCFLIAWAFGFGPALLAVALGTLGANFAFYDPVFTFKILHWEDAMRLGIFSLTSIFAAALVARGRRAEDSYRSTQSRLKESEGRFRRLADEAPALMWGSDPNGACEWVNRGWLEFTGRSLEQELGWGWTDGIHPDDVARVREFSRGLTDGGKIFSMEFRLRHHSGEYRWMLNRATPRHSPEGEFLGLLGTCLDVHEQHEAVAARKETVEVLETVNQVGKSLSAELDMQKLVQDVTDAATRLSRAQFGAFFYNVLNREGGSYMLYTISGVPREKFSLFPMPRNTAVFAPTFAGEGIVRSDDITKDPRYGKNAPRVGMPEGHLPVRSYLAVPVISRSGEVIGALFFGHGEVGVFSEREERIVAGLASQAAIAMDNARLFERANEAVRIRDEFLSISSHELRTPLTPLKMQIQAIGRALDRGTLATLPEEKLRKMVTTCDRQINRITTLVSDLLDVSRISTGKLTLNVERVNLSEAVAEVIERYLPELQTARCEVKLHLAPGVEAEVDRLRFEQVLVNFLTNSIRYAPAKPVEVSLLIEGNEVLLRVKDFGIGISAADQARIFGRFERVLSSANYGGLGLGLFIVNQIVAAHGGRVSVQSEVGAGAEFTARFPLRHVPGGGARTEAVTGASA